jgi:hypothetical protein
MANVPFDIEFKHAFYGSIQSILVNWKRFYQLVYQEANLGSCQN